MCAAGTSTPAGSACDRRRLDHNHDGIQADRPTNTASTTAYQGTGRPRTRLRIGSDSGKSSGPIQPIGAKQRPNHLVAGADSAPSKSRVQTAAASTATGGKTGQM